jgi:3'-phosphoadenosine 5'-phosphosulfate sulfotransferase (PAPS reductase)/FAD synthetase
VSAPRHLGKKQLIRDQATWREAVANARQTVPDDVLDNLVDKTVDQLRATIAGKRVAYAWSGGKDSLALQVIAEKAGIEDSVLAMSGLEFPIMLQWLTDNMPDGLTIKHTGQDLHWLAKHPAMLFPQGAKGPQWFTIVNHKGQSQYFKDEKLDMLVLGRRRHDMNFCGPKGVNTYTNAQGITRHSPLADWTHEEVFALLDREGVSMPPCYEFPRGYQVGTGAWPARQWTKSVDHGFEETWEVDPSVVIGAAEVLPQARDWLQRTGKA